ncbi:unnamed protein product, partial [Choristocarpus tenellus]
VPVFVVSSVTAKGLSHLRVFLGGLTTPEPLATKYREARSKAAEVRISDTFLVEGVEGEVYAGTVVSGVVSVGDRLLLGPSGSLGSFVSTTVASVHVSRTAVRSASAGQTASFSLIFEETRELRGASGREVGDGESKTTKGGKKIQEEEGSGGSGCACCWVGDDVRCSLHVDGAEGEGENGGGEEKGRGGCHYVPQRGLGLAADSLRDGGGCGGTFLAEDLSPTARRGRGVGKCSNASGSSEGGSPSSRMRKGMVLVEASSRPCTTFEFDAEVMVLHHPR